MWGFFFFHPEFSVLERLCSTLHGQLTMHSTDLCRVRWGQPYDLQMLTILMVNDRSNQLQNSRSLWTLD